jgi:hypothetical protein
MEEPEVELHGLTRLRAGALERVSVRRRESAITTGAWRLAVLADQGTGTITRVEGAAELHWRGDGMLLGWPADRLAELYALLTGPVGRDDTGIDFQQLG